MALRIITPPAIEPVSLAEAKAHLRVEVDEEDALITSLILSAREYCESFQNRAYITQTWELWLDAWPAKDYIRIPRPPLQSVESIKYYSPDNTENIMDAADYFVDDKSEPGRLALACGKSWPSATLRPTNGIVVQFVAGYGDEAISVLQMVKQAMLLLIGYWYDNREAAIFGAISREVQFAVKTLLWLGRVVPL